MVNQTHCEVCLLCTKTERNAGSVQCKNKIIRKFYDSYWHNGLHWYVLQKGRVLTKETIVHSKNGRRSRIKNKDTTTHIVGKYTSEHEEVLREWSEDISGFKREGHIDKYIFYMSTHPFSLILEFRLNGYLVGFSWLIVMDNTVIQQTFPWRKKRFSHLSLGVFENEVLVDLWPSHIHLLGPDTEFKNKFGGWTYEGPLQLDRKYMQVEEREETSSSNN